MESASEKRLSYIDTAKAYLIFCVITGHVLIVINPGYEKILFACGSELIYAFHMSAFFVLHGVLFHLDKWKNYSLS